MTESTHEEITGYLAGENPEIGSVELPNGARFAVRIQLVLEDWTRLPTMAEAKHHGVRTNMGSADLIDYRELSARLYGLRTGIHRLLKVMDETGCTASVSTSGLCGDRWPEIVAEISARGHEIVAHGYSMDEEMAHMTEEEDFEVIQETLDVLERATGIRPVGWASTAARRGKFTAQNNLRAGIIHTNDFREADFPFVVARLGDRQLVAMPRSDEINDNYALHNSGLAPSNYVEYFKRSFDRLYRESEAEPGRVLTAVCHSTVIGHPWGASAVAECCDYTRQHEDVWQTTSREIAENYLRNLKPRSRR